MWLIEYHELSTSSSSTICTQRLPKYNHMYACWLTYMIMVSIWAPPSGTIRAVSEVIGLEFLIRWQGDTFSGRDPDVP